MKPLTAGASFWAAVLMLGSHAANAAEGPATGVASWYGEAHRGRLMANGKRFNPEKLTAASWFYPLGTRVEVRLKQAGCPLRSVVVRITDRGPAHELVNQGRMIDLSHAAFVRLASPELGLVAVKIQPVPLKRAGGTTAPPVPGPARSRVRG
jgi:rare lipoprotein A